PSGRSAAEIALLPYLHHRGVRGIDLLMVSHGDQDHSGGLSTVLAALPVRAVMLGPSMSPLSSGSSTCEYGRQWQWDGVTFTVLHPASGSGASTRARSGNHTSCVLHIEGRDGSALLTGDIDAAA